MCYALDLGVAEEQRVALERFRETEAQLYAKARAAIYDYYRETYSQFQRVDDVRSRDSQDVPTELPRLPSRSGESETEAAYRARIEAALGTRFSRRSAAKSSPGHPSPR